MKHEWTKRPEDCPDCCHVANWHVDAFRIAASLFEEEKGWWRWRVDVVKKDQEFGKIVLGSLQAATLFEESEATRRAEEAMELAYKIVNLGEGGFEGSSE